MSSLKSQSPLEYPQMHTVLPSPSAWSGVPYLRKRSRSPWLRQPLGSWHHQLCCHHDLLSFQNHVAPSHCHHQESFNPFSSQQGLSCFLRHVAKGSTPKLTLAKAVWSPTTPKSCEPQPSFFSLSCRCCNQRELPPSYILG